MGDNDAVKEEIQQALDEIGEELFYKRLVHLGLTGVANILRIFDTENHFLPFAIEEEEVRYYHLGLKRYIDHLTKEQIKEYVSDSRQELHFVFKSDRLQVLFHETAEQPNLILDDDVARDFIRDHFRIGMHKTMYLNNPTQEGLYRYVTSCLHWIETYFEYVPSSFLRVLDKHGFGSIPNYLHIQAEIYRHQKYTFFHKLQQRHQQKLFYLLDKAEFDHYVSHQLQQMQSEMNAFSSLDGTTPPSMRELKQWNQELKRINKLSFMPTEKISF